MDQAEQPVTSTDWEDTSRQSARLSRRTGWWMAAGTAAVVAATAAILVVRQSPRQAAERPATPGAVATVQRTDLIERERVDGTLRYAGSYPIAGSGGVLTWLPAPGREIRRGQQVYGVDGRLVRLFYGPTPLWRDLRVGVSNGADVLAVERNLAALGYRGMTVDNRFTEATRAAVRRWQEDARLPRTGVVTPAMVVVTPDAIRVGSVPGLLGRPAQGNVLLATGTRRVVAVDLPAAKQQLAVEGAEVVVELPTGGSTSGVIAGIGTVATSSGDADTDGAAGQGQPGQAVQNATIPVEIRLGDPSAAGRLDHAPVTVGFTLAMRRGVLAVPVTALVAHPEGGYAVEVVDGTADPRLLPVRPGAFADGQVEVSGDGLVEGMRIEVPAP